MSDLAGDIVGLYGDLNSASHKCAAQEQEIARLRAILFRITEVTDCGKAYAIAMEYLAPVMVAALTSLTPSGGTGSGEADQE